MASRIIFTGKDGNWTAGKSAITEAEAFASIAIGMGVAANNLILEKEATNIGQNILLSKKIMDAHGWASAIIVTKPQTTLRTRLTINTHADMKQCLVHAPAYTMNEFIVKFGREQLFNEMVGDIDRIIQYPAKGFQEAINIPHHVLEAFEMLKQAGFTKHLLRAC
jgi:hypothetical protein